MTIIWLVAGLILLIVGANLFVSGAASFAKTLGVSPLVIGLTVVAFGTSAPELAVNVNAALGGNTDVAFGNIIGSNIVNIALILGMASLLRPLVVEKSIIAREIPMMLVATAAFFIMSSRSRIDGGDSLVGRSDGILLLLFFGIFLFYTAKTAMRKKESDPFLAEVSDDVKEKTCKLPLIVSLPLAGIGLYLTIKGGDWSVESAVAVAKTWGMSDAVIGLTVLAVGTSLPELVVSCIAAIQGRTEMAVGNVVGSNIFNILFVGGVTACVKPIQLPDGGYADLVVLSLFSILLFPLAFSSGVLSRKEGIILAGAWVAYTACRILM